MKKFLPKKSKKLSIELAYILGVFLGDGSITGNRSIVLATTDEDFAKEFMKNMKRWSGIESSMKQLPGKISNFYGRLYESKSSWLASTHSVEIVNFLKNFDLSSIKSASSGIKAAFLRGLFDSDGSITRTRNVVTLQLTNTNKMLINLVFRLMKDLGFEDIRITKEKARFSSKIVYRIRTGRKYNILLFYKKVGFSIKRKQSKLREIVKFLNENVKKSRWNKKELLFLRGNYQKLSYKEIAKIIKRSPGTIQRKASNLRLRKSIKWDKNMIIRELKKVAKKLNRSSTQYDLIRLNKINLYAACFDHFGSFNKAKEAAGLNINHRRWTKEEKKMLKMNFGTISLNKLSQKLNRSERAIREMYYSLKKL